MSQALRSHHQGVRFTSLPPEVKEMVARELLPVDRMALARVDAAVWAASFPTPEQVFPLVQRHRLLPEAALLGPERLRAFLEIPAHLAAPIWGRPVLAVAGAAVLITDGSVRIRVSRGRSRLVDLGGRRAMAVAGGGPDVTAVLCADGTLLLHQHRPWCPVMVVPIRDRVVRMTGGYGCLYALTEGGQLFGWQQGGGHELLLAVDPFGPYRDLALAEDVRDLAVPAAQVAVGVDDESAVHSVYAVDATGLRVWGCGAGVRRDDGALSMHVRLTRLPDPPAAVRHLLVAGRVTRARAVPEEGGEEAGTGTVRLVSHGAVSDDIGPLALLVDGTLWSPVLARRIPLDQPDRKVLGMAATVPGMAAHGRGVRLLLDGGEAVTAWLSPDEDRLITGGPW